MAKTNSNCNPMVLRSQAHYVGLSVSGGGRNKFKVWPTHIVDHKVRFKLKTIYTHVIYDDLQMQSSSKQQMKWPEKALSLAAQPDYYSFLRISLISL